ncbi:MAG: hypothetical protein JO338_09750 [Aquitalea sp.]|nr:hypothetical protein [Aquitalea sp.]
MQEQQMSQQALEYLTHYLRHAVSNGQYLTPQRLEQAITSYRDEYPAANSGAVHQEDCQMA